MVAFSYNKEDHPFVAMSRADIAVDASSPDNVQSRNAVLLDIGDSKLCRTPQFKLMRQTRCSSPFEEFDCSKRRVIALHLRLENI
jgi:hypothetical protein